MRAFALILFLCLSAAAQSGRLNPAAADTPTPGPPAQTVKQLFVEANGYLRAKAAEFESKKIPFTDNLFAQLKLEQRQLAAKYAAASTARKDLTGEDFYYLGMLHWIAENLDGAAENLSKFTALDVPPAERKQSARAIITVIAAKQKKLDAAEASLAGYLKADAKRPSEIYRMEVEIAKAYQTAGDFVKMAPHAENAYTTSKSELDAAPSRATAIDEIFDSGMLVFEAYRALGDQTRADSSIADLRRTAASAQSPSLYYYAADRQITYMIETGRKREAIEDYLAALTDSQKDLPTVSSRADAFDRLKRREKHYKLLGEPVPEFPEFDKWMPGTPQKFAEMKGKVVLLDFWAMWCGPCIAAFPSLRQWHADHEKDGLVVLGVTRYYGADVGAKTQTDEIEMLTDFRHKHDLPYDLVIANGQILQLQFGAMSLPTAVLIDRKGIIRYIETGTGPTRLVEMHAMIEKLLAEK